MAPWEQPGLGAGGAVPLMLDMCGSQMPVGRWGTYGRWVEYDPVAEPEIPPALQQIPYADLTKVG